MYVGNQWEMIGSTTIDLTDYPTYDDISIVQGLTTGIPAATITVGATTTTIYSNPKKIWYGTCNSSATTSPKIVSGISSSDFLWEKGSIVCVKFTYTNSTNPFKLMIGGISKDVYLDGRTTSINGCFWSANSIVTFLYDGTRFEIISKSSYDLDYSRTGHTHNYSKVLFTPTLVSGTTIGTITVDGTTSTLYAPDNSIYYVEVETGEDEDTYQFINDDSYASIIERIDNGQEVAIKFEDSIIPLVGNSNILYFSTGYDDESISFIIDSEDNISCIFTELATKNYVDESLGDLPHPIYYVDIEDDGNGNWSFVNDDTFSSLIERYENDEDLVVRYANENLTNGYYLGKLFSQTPGYLTFINIDGDSFSISSFTIIEISEISGIAVQKIEGYVPIEVAGVFNAKSRIDNTSASLTLYNKEVGNYQTPSGDESSIILQNGNVNIDVDNEVNINDDINYTSGTGINTYNNTSLKLHDNSNDYIEITPYNGGNIQFTSSSGAIGGLANLTYQGSSGDQAANKNYVDSRINTVTATIPSITATAGLTTGVTIGAIDINGVTTTLYAPEDTKVTQTDVSGVTENIRYPILVSSQSHEIGTTTTSSIKSDYFEFSPGKNYLIISNSGSNNNGGLLINDYTSRYNLISAQVATAGTSTTIGKALVNIGNRYTTEDGPGNSMGSLAIFGKQNTVNVILPLDETLHEGFTQYENYLPIVDDVVLAAGVTTGVGSSTVPVYMAAGGELIACSLPTSASYSLSMTGATITLLADGVAASTITLPIYDGTIQ